MTDADWFNDVNRLHYTIFGDPATLAAAFATINNLTEDTSPVTSTDFVVTYDASATTAKKVRLSNIAGGGLTLQTPVASTSGTSIDFTGLSSVKRFTLMLNGVSTNGSSVLRVQIGPTGGIETTGYRSGATNGVGTAAADTSGFMLKSSTHAAADLVDGQWIGTLESSTNNSWTFCGGGYWSSTAQVGAGGGSKSLAGALTRVRLTTQGGTDTFDAGEVNIATE